MSQRDSQVRHWLKKIDALAEAIRDGWSTFWVAKEFNIPPQTVRKLRRDLGA